MTTMAEGRAPSQAPLPKGVIPHPLLRPLPNNEPFPPTSGPGAYETNTRALRQPPPSRSFLEGGPRPLLHRVTGSRPEASRRTAAVYPAPLHVVTATFSPVTQSRSGSLPPEATGHRGSRNRRRVMGWGREAARARKKGSRLRRHRR